MLNLSLQTNYLNLLEKHQNQVETIDKLKKVVEAIDKEKKGMSTKTKDEMNSEMYNLKKMVQENSMKVFEYEKSIKIMEV